VILLDTHVLLWLMAAPDRIGAETQARVRGAAKVFFSSVSVAEARIKTMTGRLDIPADLARDLRAQGLVALPLTDEHATALDQLPELVRHDPFDRLLLAQALVERCELVTSDARLLSLQLPWVHDARR
jgi:PIN domain nuclease of toxin-antitoxin system